jgi:acyl dehydratase
VRILNGAADVRAAVGTRLGESDPFVVTQADVDSFAELTGDDQWIHVDVERAARGPFGGTIAHGLLTLSLGPRMARSLYRIDGMAMGVNYGYNKIRFPAPVPVGSKVRMSATLTSVEDVPGAILVGITFAWTVEGAAKPACVAEMLIRYAAEPVGATS